MSFNLSTPSNTIVIPEVEEPEHLITRADAPNKPSYHTKRALKCIPAQKGKVIGSWTQAFEDQDGEDAGNVDKQIKIEV